MIDHQGGQVGIGPHSHTSSHVQSNLITSKIVKARGDNCMFINKTITNAIKQTELMYTRRQ